MHTAAWLASSRIPPAKLIHGKYASTMWPKICLKARSNQTIRFKGMFGAVSVYPEPVCQWRWLTLASKKLNLFFAPSKLQPTLAISV